jgi:microcystin-dependent protein
MAMCDPYLGEIKLFAFRKKLIGWLPCDGSILNISASPALYSLLGTNYGGDGKTTFGIPDLRGRVPACYKSGDSNFGNYGKRGGETGVTVVTGNLPLHTHTVNVNSQSANANVLSDTVLSTAQTGCQAFPYGPASTPLVTIDPDTVPTIGGGLAHNNMQPYSVLCYYIASSGVYPTR